MGMCDFPRPIGSSRRRQEQFRIDTVEFEVSFNENQESRLQRLAQRYGAEINEGSRTEYLTKNWKPKSPREFYLSLSIHERHDWQGFQRAVAASGMKIEQWGDPIGAIVTVREGDGDYM